MTVRNDWVNNELLTSTDLNDTFDDVVDHVNTNAGDVGVNGALSFPIGGVTAWLKSFSGEIVMSNYTSFAAGAAYYVTGAQLIAEGMTSGQEFAIRSYNRCVTTDYAGHTEYVSVFIYNNTSAAPGGTLLYSATYLQGSGTTAFLLVTTTITAASWDSSTYFYFLTENNTGDTAGYTEFDDITFEAPSLLLPAGWVQCDGQTLSDAESPYNGVVIPNLNGVAGGAAGSDGQKYNRFLRGNATSGTAGGALTHTHYLSGSYQRSSSTGNQVYLVSNQTTGAANNAPPYYDVVYIMRIK